MTSRIISRQSPGAGASPDFVRKVRNFMNNWEVDGGSFKFDGYKVKLRTNANSKPVQIGLNLWELYQEDSGTNPLQVSMRSGVCVNTNTTSLYPTNSVINWTTANVTVSQTTIFWLKVSVAKATYQTYFEVWGVTAMVVQTGTTLPTDTLDIPAGTDGDLYFQIGSVVADGTEVTSIVQDISYPITVVFPLGVVGEEFTCPVEE
jgi:hypothetical protein